MDKRSTRNLIGVADKLQLVAIKAFDYFDYEVTQLSGCAMVITDGVRTLAEQEEYVRAGASWTMDSYHLPWKDGKAYAIDFALVHRNKVVQEMAPYERVWLGCYRPASIQIGVELTWGGRWKSKDGPHIQMKRPD